MVNLIKYFYTNYSLDASYKLYVRCGPKIDHLSSHYKGCQWIEVELRDKNVGAFRGANCAINCAYLPPLTLVAILQS
jgi:hypothetical protein